MNKALVMYSTKYGTTKKYAQWIAEELQGDMYDVKDVYKKDLTEYDVIILGSSLYAGNIKGLDIFIKHFDRIKNRKLIIFTCGLADYSKEVNRENIYKRLSEAVPKNILDCINVVYLRGGINYRKLTLLHKIMMAMMRKMILGKGREKLDEDDKVFLETYGKEIDFTDKNTIKPIIDFCNTARE